MERIYFDKQVFSYLFKGELPVYQNLYSKLINNKQNYIFLYSEALLLDLKTSDPIIRDKELKFIESIVGNNYIYHNAQTNKTINHSIIPIDAFSNSSFEFESFSFSKMFDDLETEHMGENERKLIQSMKSLMVDLKFNFFDETLFANIPENLKKLVPFTGKEMSFQNFFDSAIQINRNLIEDKSLFKELRNVVSDGINKGKFILREDEIDFNDQLKFSEIKKTFVDFVYDSIKGNKKEVSNYDFHTNAYLILEILGITKEPSKSIKFRNLQNDGFHSYYGGYSDIVVSDDTNFVKKSKVLYKLLGIQTKVLNIEEFVLWFDNAIKSKNEDFKTLLSNILDTINDNKLILSDFDELYQKSPKVFESKFQFFDYFNTLYLNEFDNQKILFITKRLNSYSYFTYFREFEFVVNKTIEFFGMDIDEFGKYNFETENQLIENMNWDGRRWIVDNYYIHLQTNSGINEFGLLIRSLDDK